MKKDQLIREITKKSNIEVKQVRNIVEALMITIKDSLIKNEPVHLRGFGTFKLKKRASKIARNIKKNTPLLVPEHYIPSFKPAKEFNKRVHKYVK